jgi:hypothetical protein
MLTFRNEQYILSKNNLVIGKTNSHKIYEHDFLVEKKGKKFHIFDKQLSLILETSNKPIQFIKNDFFVSESNEYVGLQNLDGDTILPFKFKKIYTYGKFIITYHNNIYTVYNECFKILRTFEKAKIYVDWHTNQLLVKDNNKVVILDSTIKKIFKWDIKGEIDTFHVDYILTTNKKIYFKTGELIQINNVVQKVYFQDHLLVIKSGNNQYQVFYKNQKELFATSAIHHFNYYGYGIFSFFDKTMNKYRLYSTITNKEISDFEKIYGTFDKNHQIIIKVGNVQQVIDTNLNITYTNYSDELISSYQNHTIIKKNTGYTIMNKRKELVSVPLHGKITDLHENLYQVEQKPLYGIIDSKGIEIIPTIFENISILPNGYFQTIIDKTVTYYDTKGTKITLF